MILITKTSDQTRQVCVCVLFTFLTDRASTIRSSIRGVTWCVGQEKIRGTSSKFQREREHENENKAKKRQKEKKNQNKT